MEGVLAQIIWFAADFAPKNWMLCQGQSMPINQYSALFSLLGTTYGGNGTTTFNLPDYRGRVPVGAGNGAGLSPYRLGQVGGSETTTMLINQMPAHSHNITVRVSVANLTGTTDEADGNCIALAPTNNFAPASSASGTLGGATLTDGPTGGGQPFPILQPTLCVNFVICVVGIFPSRN